ncbi:MAG: HEAT repeat domain-containing protein [Kofleriaceae bacterium]
MLRAGRAVMVASDHLIRSWTVAAVVAIAVLVMLSPSKAIAQPVDAPALIKLIEQQPAGMDRAEWKEKRRDAARKLAQTKDKRAVAVLIKLVDTETFDIIGDIAIEGLGNLGDTSAVPALQRAANDTTRDKATRELAKKSLGKLGATVDPKAGTRPPTTTGTTTLPVGPGTSSPTGSSGSTGSEPGGNGDATTQPSDTTSSPADGGPTTSGHGAGLTGASGSSRVEPHALPGDALAAYDRLTFAAGAASLSYDTIRETPSIEADVAGRFERRIERATMAWGFDAGAHVVAGFISPPGRAQTRGLIANINGGGEARFYRGQIYGVGKLRAATQLTYVSDADPDDAGADIKDVRTTGDLQAVIGAGYGRVLDVGGAIRVRRLGRTLDAARALGRPIDQATARQLQLTWWALRRERSAYPALVETVRILREAGILLGEPDAGLSYEILNVLRDSQLFLRPSGLDIQIGVSEGYLYRPDEPPPAEAGRVEQLLALAGYGTQLNDDTFEVSGAAYARMRVLAPDDQPSPSAAGAAGRFRKFTYGDHGDPFGAFDLSADVRISDDGEDADLAMRISAELGFTWLINQASGIRLSANLTEDTGEVFIGAQLEATYGFLDGTFAGL